MNIIGLRKLSLRSQMILVMLALTFLSATVLYFILEERQQERLLSNYNSTITNLLHHRGHELQLSIEHLRRDVLFLAQTPPIQGIIQTNQQQEAAPQHPPLEDIWKAQLESIFVAFAEANPEYYQLRFIQAQGYGEELVRVDLKNGQLVTVSGAELQHKAQRHYLKRARQLQPGEVLLSEINLNREWGQVVTPHQPTLRAIAPVYDNQQQLFGVVVINQNIGALFNEATSSLPKGIISFVSNDTGDFLLHPNPDLAFNFDLGSRHRWQDEMPDLLIRNSTSSPASAHPSSQQTGYQSHSEFSHPKAQLQKLLFNEVPFHVAAEKFHFDPEHPQRFLTLAFGFSHQMLDGEMAPLQQTLLTTIMGLSYLIIAVVSLILWRMFAPLKQLTTVANHFAEGHYEAPLPQRASGEIGIFVHAFQEMTKRMRERGQKIMQLNEELTQNEATANLIFDTAPQAILVVNNEGEIIKANLKAIQFFGYTAEELLGQPVELLIPTRQKDRHVMLRQQYYDQPHAQKTPQPLSGLRKDGTEFPIEIELSPMHIDDALHIITSIIDITDRVKLETQLQVSQKMEAIGELAAGVAHEINTPLQYVGDNARFIQDGINELTPLISNYRKAIEQSEVPSEVLTSLQQQESDDDLEFLLEDIPHAVTEILSGVGKTGSIVKAMKEFSHPGQKQKAPIDINHILKNTITVSRNEWKYCAELETNFDEQLPQIMGLPIINQVFLNMTVNAAHAIREKLGNEPKQKGLISIQTKNLNNKIEIRISDTGTGIDEQHLNKVFDPFFTTKEVGKGTGQGLSISYNIVVDQFNGTIEVDSIVGEGTTFIIRLPIQNSASTQTKKSADCLEVPD